MVPFPRRLPHTTSPVEGAGFEPSVPGAKEPVSFAEGELRGIERGRPTKVISLRGTDGSNPSPSTGESTANLASSFRGSHRPRASRPRRRPPTVERVEHAPEEPRRGMDRTIDQRKSPRTLLIIIFDIAAAYRASERSWPSGARPRRS